MLRRSTFRRRRYFKATEKLGCAHSASFCDGVDGVDGAPSLKTGQMGRNENDGVVRRVSTELSVDGELGAPKLSVDAVDAPSTENMEKRRSSVDGVDGESNNSQVCTSYNLRVSVSLQCIQAQGRAIHATAERARH
jgi:hypothetical protein